MAWLLQVGGDLLCSPLLHASPSVPHQCGRALGGPHMRPTSVAFSHCSTGRGAAPLHWRRGRVNASTTGQDRTQEPFLQLPSAEKLEYG